MKDSKGRVCEYDDYVIPERGEDTSENRKLREDAMREFKKKAKELKTKRELQISVQKQSSGSSCKCKNDT